MSSIDPTTGPFSSSSKLLSSSISVRSADTQQKEVEFNALLRSQIQRSQGNRASKMSNLTEEQSKTFASLKYDVEQVRNLASHIRDMLVEPNKNNDELKKLQADLLEISYVVYDKYTSFNLQPKSISILAEELELDLWTESVLNGAVNRFCYLNEIQDTLLKEKKAIVEKFGISIYDDIIIAIPENETHNQGKSAAFITLKQGESQEFKLVYKPRNGEVDDYIVSSFRKINDLTSSEKSSQFSLPSYSIYQCQKQQASIWEFISGKSLRPKFSKNPITLGSYVEGKSIELQIKAARLDDVLSQLHVTDQHGENILIGRNKDIFPIDLEAVYFPHTGEKPVRTGMETAFIRENLVKNQNYLGLTPQEMTIIQSALPKISTCIVRLIPMDTYGLVKKLVQISNYEDVVEIFRKSIVADHYSPNKEILDTLKENIIFDYLNSRP